MFGHYTFFSHVSKTATHFLRFFLVRLLSVCLCLCLCWCLVLIPATQPIYSFRHITYLSLSACPPTSYLHVRKRLLQTTTSIRYSGTACGLDRRRKAPFFFLLTRETSPTQLDAPQPAGSVSPLSPPSLFLLLLTYPLFDSCPGGRMYVYCYESICPVHAFAITFCPLSRALIRPQDANPLK